MFVQSLTPSRSFAPSSGLAAAWRSRSPLHQGSVSPTGDASGSLPQIPGLAALWNITKGDPRVTIAVIDGPVDVSHPCFAGVSLRTLHLKGRAPVICRSKAQGSCNHGTQIASLLFARHGCGPVQGIAPRCRGLIVPIFRDNPLVAGGVLPSSQSDLAKAIDLARDHGAQIINISSGQMSTRGRADPQLEAAVRRCAESGVLIVSAAGNDGCDCLHVPAALPDVLVVGALDGSGRPAEFSNYGDLYRPRGLLAPGENLRVASNGGGFEVQTGTSFAAPLVAGVAALLLSTQYGNGPGRGGPMKPLGLRDLLLQSARGCDAKNPTACRRFLAGTLDIQRALTLLGRGEPVMNTPNSEDQTNMDEAPDTSADASDHEEHQVSHPVQRSMSRPAAAAAQAQTRAQAQVRPSSRGDVRPSCKGGGGEGCSCGGGEGKCGCAGGSGGGDKDRPPLVYALGTLSYDFGTQARFDSIAAEIGASEGGVGAPVGPIPASIDTGALLAHLAANPYVAESITWTLNLDATPIYAIRPDGAYAASVYERLRQFLSDQVDGKVRAERVALPGYMVGTQTLLTGQKVGVVVPELRGMYNWTVGALVSRAVGKPPDEKAAKADRDAFRRKEEGITNFLQRVYSEVRNLGLEPRDRALNFAATNAFQIERMFTQTAGAGLQLDQIDVERSPICRLDSECWDVVAYFFNPANVLGEARRAFRFTVDVSDVVPVLIGDIREWAVR
jgi:cyanobactin maturation PatA/PatG family protease